MRAVFVDHGFMQPTSRHTHMSLVFPPPNTKRQTDRDRETETERQRDREKVRQRQRHRQTDRCILFYC